MHAYGCTVFLYIFIRLASLGGGPQAHSEYCIELSEDTCIWTLTQYCNCVQPYTYIVHDMCTVLLYKALIRAHVLSYMYM